MTPEEFLEKHLEVVFEALGDFRSAMEDKAANWRLVGKQVPEAAVLQDAAKAFEKLADAAGSATSDLVHMTEWDKDRNRILRKKKS